MDLNNTYWERVRGYPTEHRVDSRWLLKKNDDPEDKTYGSLRVVSHPDLPPGQLRSIFMYITNLRNKSNVEILQTIEDYKVKLDELEIYSIDKALETDKIIYEGPFNDIEEMYNVNIFK